MRHHIDLKLIAKVRKIADEYHIDDMMLAIEKIRDEQEYEFWDSGVRENHFKKIVAELGLTIVEGTGTPARCLFIKEFKDLEHSHPTTPCPYFMFWRESTSHNSQGHIEFGHWHQNKKWYKLFPTTEYYYGVKTVEYKMREYFREYEDIIKT